MQNIFLYHRRTKKTNKNILRLVFGPAWLKCVPMCDELCLHRSKDLSCAIPARHDVSRVVPRGYNPERHEARESHTMPAWRGPSLTSNSNSWAKEYRYRYLSNSPYYPNVFHQITRRCNFHNLNPRPLPSHNSPYP